MRKALRVAAVVILVLCVIAAGLWSATRSLQAKAWIADRLAGDRSPEGVEPERDGSSVVASGFIEADVVHVTAQHGGRVLRVLAGEGDTAVQGQLLAQLDDSILRSRIKSAEADLAYAQAMLDQVRNGAAPETLRRAEAEAAQARAVRNAAQVTWQDALAMLENPQDLELALAAVQGELAVLGYRQEQAEALANSEQSVLALADDILRMLEGIEPYEEWIFVGEYELGQLPPGIPLPPNPVDGTYYLAEYKIVIHDGLVTVYVRLTIGVPVSALEEAREKQAGAAYSSWNAWAVLDQAEAARQGVENLLAELGRQRENPLSLQAQVNAAEANYRVATAAVELAESQVEGLEIGATPEQIGVAEAQVDIARSALRTLETELDEYVLRSPISGVVLERAVSAGEVVAQGVSVFDLADLDQLTLTAYVPEGQLSRIEIGQEVLVSVDAFPGSTFRGVVTGIASRAEFAPQNVESKEDRADIVFSVQVLIDNLDGALKPGMPADARFLSREAKPEPAAEGGPAEPAGYPGGSETEESVAQVTATTATGSLEGDEIAIVSELGGRIERVLAGEGDEVAEGQVVVELDSRGLSAQLAEARAAEAGAMANLAQVKAGVHPAEVLSARAALEHAIAKRNAAESALHDVQALLRDPQDLNAQLVEVRASIATAEAQVEQARAGVAAAEAERDRYRSQGSLEEKGMYAAWSYRAEAASAVLEAAQASVLAAQKQLEGLEAMRDNPLAILSRVHAAQGNLEVATAGAVLAQARLDEHEAAPGEARVRVAEAQVEQSRAIVQVVQTQMDLLSLRSPIGGVVTSCLVHPGEAAVAGAVLMQVTVLDDLSLAVYVTAEQLGGVYLGQAVEVRVDAYPDLAFRGVVSKISGQAEFAPSKVETEVDQASMVVEVTVRLPNTDHRLRPGMPADAIFLGQ